MFSSPRVWFITGASTGFGYNLTRHALDKGDIVVATLRNPSTSDLPTKYPHERLLLLKLDVTDTPAISSAFTTAREKFGRIDVVFNNAGHAILCELENTPEDKARALFDTNFWGAVNVSKEAIKAFRANSPPGGRLLQNSSSSASTNNPGTAFYGASKAGTANGTHISLRNLSHSGTYLVFPIFVDSFIPPALEAMSESLAQELDPNWNIKITLIESGPFNTAALGSNMLILPPSEPYIPSTDPSQPLIGANQTRLWISSGELYKIAGDPVKGARVFYELGSREVKEEGGEKVKEPYERVVLHPYSVLAAERRIGSVRRAVEAFEGEWKAWLE
ncbi:hypothetical protein NP233_g6740 [Leucocoprinus birnbaumii]|uniref:NAD(P)-binding protein n=1 Tax=Leucocoprinus birnbaumii TaxID=56174 RepID=A0AAD5VW35_9AGAR|nr:hypothetical protein NP233_g6740 [Leucocoprinus birnbaumii]